MKFRTPDILPDMGMRRFSTLELGTANVETLRDEHKRLATAVAKLLGKESSELTYEDVRGLDERQLVPVAAPSDISTV